MKVMGVLTALVLVLLVAQHVAHGSDAWTGLYISQLKDLPGGWLSYGALLSLASMLLVSAVTHWRARSHGFAVLHAISCGVAGFLMVSDARDFVHVAAYIVLLSMIPAGYGWFLFVNERWLALGVVLTATAAVGCAAGSISGPLLQKSLLIILLALLDWHYLESVHVVRHRRAVLAQRA